MEKKHPKLPCFVTDDGRVRRIDSNVYSFCPKYKHGYHQITFHIEHTGKQKACLVHRLVWECFVGEIPQGMQINHKESGGLSSKIPLEIRVDVIRQLPSKSNKELARMIDVDCSVISNVRHRKTWKDAWDLFNKRSNDHPERE